MITAPTGACAAHRRRNATARCATCATPLCTECVIATPVGLKCGRCTGARGERRGRRTPRWAPVAVALGLLAVVFAGSRLLSGDEGDEASRPAGVASAPQAGERTVQLTSAGGARIAGTLLMPRVETGVASVPAVLIIPGFGPTNRDGVAPPGGTPDRLYADIASALAEKGVASFRYDKRGTGQSLLPADRALRFEDFVADAKAGVSFLAERKGVNPEAIAVLGHDEGGLVALQLAVRERRVRGLVLVSTPGRPLVDVLADDVSHSARDEASAARLVSALREAAGALVATGSLPAGGGLPAELRPVFPPGQEAYLRDIFSIDPSAVAARVTVPVLVVRGSTDPGVSAADADRLAAAAGGPIEVLVSEGGGHTLARPGTPPPADAMTTGMHDDQHRGGATAGSRDEQVLDRLAEWVAARLRATP